MDGLIAQWSRLPNLAKLTIILALPTSGFITARFLDDYKGWLAMGPGGLPYNLRGYLVNLYMTWILGYRDTTTLAIYDQPERYAVGWKQASDQERLEAKKSFLTSPLNTRSGPRSAAIPYAAPQREKDEGDYIDPDLKAAHLAAFDKLAEKYNDAIEWKTSVLERRGKAMFLKTEYTLPTLIAKCRREVAHLHGTDVSGHVNLSFSDAKEVIAKGWGERHRLTGSVIPLGYTMIYVPRNHEELDVLMRIVEAGIQYAMSRGKAT